MHSTDGLLNIGRFKSPRARVAVVAQLVRRRTSPFFIYGTGGHEFESLAEH